MVGIEENCPVYLLPVGSMVAIVSKLPQKKFSSAVLKKKLQEPDWLVYKAHLHEAVVEAIMRQGTVVPLRLMTLFQTETSLLEALLPHEATIKDFLEYVQDKAEWALKIYLDKARAKGYLLKNCKDLVESAENTHQSPGGRYLLEKQRERKAEEGLLRLTRLTTEEVSKRLAPLCEDFRPLKPLDKTITSSPWEMIYNGALLVTNNNVKALRKEVSSLRRDYRQKGFIFQLSGPWPPYNFCPSLPGDEGSNPPELTVNGNGK
jgi:hypothetical protein